LFANYTSFELSEIKRIIGNYLFLTLINNKSDEELLNKSYNKFFNNCSSIITFNYDLNWEPPSIYDSNFQFKWFDDDNNYFFPDYLKKEKKRSFSYQGAHSSKGWILTSLIKQFIYDEIIQVWNQAFKALNKADEIIFIGYSLPRADSAIYALFLSIEWENKIVKLIDPNSKKLIENYSFVLRKSNKEIIPVSLENYLCSNAYNM
jgi:hypothetical protein